MLTGYKYQRTSITSVTAVVLCTHNSRTLTNDKKHYDPIDSFF